MFQNDELIFADDNKAFPETGKEEKKENWKIMIVDDEEGVHLVTKLALEGFEFEGKGLEFISAYSGEEAKRLIKENPDTAVILLDVVMEEDDAGLKVAEYIRKELENRTTRIILRTGQPGQAPEQQVIVDYDINDYKTKTELTAQKLFTTVVAALRSYRDLKIIENGKKGLEKIIEASASIFELKSFEKFVEGVLKQLTSFLNIESNSIYMKTSYFATTDETGELYIVAGTGKYSDLKRKKLKEAVNEEVYNLIKKAVDEQRTVYGDNACAVFFKYKDNGFSVIYIEGYRPLDKWNEKLFTIFCNNIAIALDNVILLEKIIKKEVEIEEYISERDKMKKTLEKYIGKERADNILSREDILKSDKKYATILFLDIRDFTKLTEEMDPEKVIGLLNDFFTRVVDIIFEFGGSLDKFIGDGLLAVFGVPVECENKEEKAVKTALKIKEVVEKWNKERIERGEKPIKISIGIHSGEVISGNIGSRKRLEYTIIGKNVNITSRVESLNREFNTDILITKETYEKVKDKVEVEKQQPVFVKGISIPMETFKVVKFKDNSEEKSDQNN
ncbi:DUF3369 domain-containing protein [Desulfurobacterium sp.]